jgi:DNA replication and repair protein RecF
MPTRAHLTRLKLWHFRNYTALDLALQGKPVVLTGPNGAGKTNLIEAVSFLAAGRGLRRAAYEDVAQAGGDGSWAVAADVDGRLGRTRIGTGMAAMAEAETRERRIRIDGATARSAAALTDHLGVLWLTPAMDGLFTGPPGDRRRFVDRLVLAFDGAHSARVNAFEKAVRSRNRLLEEDPNDPAYLAAVEAQVAELGIALAAARREAVTRLSQLLEEVTGAGAFPTAEVALEGAFEALFDEGEPAATLEDRYRAMLAASRSRDRSAGRALDGPHRSDLAVRHKTKAMSAALSSTGEQKALLIGLVLAEARLLAAITGATPLLLMDEVAAHLDPQRRRALHAELLALGAQAWLTGADANLFESLGEDAQRFRVVEGTVEEA